MWYSEEYSPCAYSDVQYLLGLFYWRGVQFTLKEYAIYVVTRVNN
jgi:hypothetical protein